MISFDSVTKIYANGTKALDDVSFTIEKGEFAFIVGASGAGKSTLLKLIMREEEPTSGHITVSNFALSSLRQKDVPQLRRSLGIVFQDFRLIENMTVYENVEFALRVTNVPSRNIRKRVSYVLGLVGLADKARSYPAQLSGGQQQRVALARALVNNPAIIIADEPTGNVDPEMSHEIVELLNEINHCGTTILMVTHEHSLVNEFGRRVITIRDGKVESDIPDGGVKS
ncbi:MAG: cell division ATP-binding protein FtsE [Oscillospiraceae bacterium]|nr:cell division ATP-binding protein FtsE [Oscillospiraceae bacterium]